MKWPKTLVIYHKDLEPEFHHLFRCINQIFSNDVGLLGLPRTPPLIFIRLRLSKLVLIYNPPLTVWSYFSFSDKSQDKRDHHIRAWFTWSLSNEEILTPQLQDDGVISLACC